MEMQNVVPTQAMDSNPLAAGMVTGANHDVPLKMVTWLRFGTAAQKVVPVQSRYDTPCGDGALPTGPRALARPPESR